VLHESYGYKPLYFASFENGRLSCLMPFMEVDSWLTGRRGVSLPFTDQCPAIVAEQMVFQDTVKKVIGYGQKAGWRYIEWRDGRYFGEEARPSESYYAHELSLSKTEKELFSGLRDSTRRNVKKAAKTDVSVKVAQSLDSVRSFYRLNCVTRKRHGLPPQPLSFFKMVFEHVISKSHGIVVFALSAGKVIASSVFFHFGKSAIFKYGASDLAHQELRANNLVMWEAIKWFREKGFETLDLGRTELDNEGLLQFKRGWGVKESRIGYHRYDMKKKMFRKEHSMAAKLMNKAFTHTPVEMLALLGRTLYRHVG
jgi:hypothetical protein